MSASPASSASPPPTIDYVDVENSPPFRELKRRHRSFVWPLTIVFVVWYLAFVLLSSFAAEFMATRVFGAITIGLLMGLGQFVTTFAITMWYVWYANHKLDPISSEIRADLEEREVAA